MKEIIKPAIKKFFAKCDYCGCEFTYEFGDVTREFAYEIGDITKFYYPTVQCPECHLYCKHELREAPDPEAPGVVLVPTPRRRDKRRSKAAH